MNRHGEVPARYCERAGGFHASGRFSQSHWRHISGTAPHRSEALHIRRFLHCAARSAGQVRWSSMDKARTCLKTCHMSSGN